jgi:hypothetical protein
MNFQRARPNDDRNFKLVLGPEEPVLQLQSGYCAIVFASIITVLYPLQIHDDEKSPVLSIFPEWRRNTANAANARNGCRNLTQLNLKL